MGRCAKICTIVSGCLGVVFIALGVSLKYAILPAVVDTLVMSQLELVETNEETWEAWVTPPVTPYMKFNFFEVNNMDEVRNGGKPNVTEIGPFSYIEVREKQNIVPIQETISFGSYIAYVYDEATSCEECKINRTVTVINPVIIMIDWVVDKLLTDINQMTIGGIPIGSIPIGGITIPDLADIIAKNVTDSINMMTKNCQDPNAPYYEFCDDIFITGTPDEMIFKGVYSGTLGALYEFLVNSDYGFLPAQISYGLGYGILDICVMMANDQLQWLYDLLDIIIISKDNEIYPIIIALFQDDIMAVCNTTEVVEVGLNMQCLIKCLAAKEEVYSDLIYKVLLFGDSALGLGDLGLIGPIVPDVIKNLIDTANLPPMISLTDGTFGFFKGTNGSKSWWKINNGKYNMDEYTQVLEFNGNSRLPDNWWPNFGPTPSADKSGNNGICHDILGTDGLSFSPGVKEDDTLWLFNDQLCRSLWLTYERIHNIDGIETYRFTPPSSVFNFSNPDNFCYCPNARDCAKPMNDSSDRWDLSECTMCRDGMISLEGCQGAPVIMSTPHFLDGDPDLAAAIDGISPDPELHQTYLHLEPLSGMPMQAHKRIQISVPLKQSARFDCMNNVTENIFPLVWVDEGADIDNENLKKAKGFLVTPFIVVDAVMGVLIALGCIMIMGAIVQMVRSRRNTNC